jgi:hypothetical protein
MDKLLISILFLILNNSSYSQNLCTIYGMINIDTNSACSNLSLRNIKEISVDGLDEKINLESNGKFVNRWIPTGEHKLNIISYNCYSTYYIDTIKVSFTCKSDSVIRFEIFFAPDCPFDSIPKTCPHCLNEDEVIPIIYKKSSFWLRQKAKKNKIILLDEDYDTCKPLWYCRLHQQSI